MASTVKNSIGETYARTVLSNWTGSHVADACIAATQLGMIHSGGGLGDERTKEILLKEFNFRKVDDVNWSVVCEAYRNGYSTVINPSELKRRFAPANDNNEPAPSSNRAAFFKMVKDRSNLDSITFPDRPKTLQLPDQVRAAMKDRFQVTWFDDVDKSPAKEEIVKGVIGAGEFSLWVAKPGTAKSVLLCDIGCHIAAGVDWHGRKVKQGLVVFFAAERKGLTERRIAAWRKKYDLSGLPFAVVGGKLDMTSNAIDAKALSATIKACEEKAGLPCRLVVIDTVTRTFGPGDQNSSKDMQRYIQSADELTRATGSHVAVIHHSGWAGDRGKGAIDLDGAVDVSFGISVLGKGPTKVFKLECTGANDGDEGDITSFRLDSVELGTDADGNVTTAPVVVQVEAVASNDGTNLKGQSARVFESLERAIQKHGTCAPDGAPGLPSGVVTVSREQWREQFYADARAKEANVKDDTLKKRFNRAVLDLTSAKEIKTEGDTVWVAGQN